MRNLYFSFLFSSMCCVVLIACEISPADRIGDPVGQAAGQLSANPCTAVALTTPAQAWTAVVGQTIQLSASATCPSGVTPEFEYWTKLVGAPNWSTLTGNPPNLGTEFVSGGASFTPSAAESRCFAVAARAMGSTDVYQVFSSGACGTVTGTVPTGIRIALSASDFDVIGGNPVRQDFTWQFGFATTQRVAAGIRLPVGARIVDVAWSYVQGPSSLLLDVQKHALGSVTSTSVTSQIIGSGTGPGIAHASTFADGGIPAIVEDGEVYEVGITSASTAAFDGAIVTYQLPST